tara:strand:- start:11318 stop:11830 length:513 start_codon:yes stop_codon:yes gene_type:complete
MRAFSKARSCLLAGATILLMVGCQGTGSSPQNLAEAPSGSDIQTEVKWPIEFLEGHWEGEAWRINSRGTSRFMDHLSMSVDANGLISAERSWKTLDGAGGHRGRTPVKKDVEELIGVFNPHNGEFRLVEMEEPGTISGQVIDENTIVFYSTQPGRQPSTSSERLSRVPAP